jgi:predicted metal-dependent enzyme (double-stranded beta helix superfamily)
MKNRDFLVTGEGQWQICKPAREWDLLRNPYYLHRFLTEVEDVLDHTTDEIECVSQLRLLVRRLITNSYWIHVQHSEPCPEKASSVLNLYDELGFPLTVQTVTTLSGTSSSVHNHGTWGIVTVLKGEEKNTFWKRIPDSKSQARVEPTGELILLPGDIISFTADAIHSIKAIGEEPTVTFSIYGETHHSKRFEFDPVTHTAKNF